MTDLYCTRDMRIRVGMIFLSLYTPRILNFSPVGTWLITTRPAYDNDAKVHVSAVLQTDA